MTSAAGGRQPEGHKDMRARACALGLLLLSGCAAAPHTRGAGVVTKLEVRPVVWNAASASVGRVRAVAEDGDVVCVFAEDRATVLSSGAVVSRDTTVKGWVNGASITAADGAGHWIVGIDGSGRVRRLRNLTAFEDVSERFGLGGQRVLGATLLAPNLVGFLLDRMIAISDGEHVGYFGTRPFKSLAGG